MSLVKAGLVASGIVAGIVILGAGVSVVTSPFRTASGVINRTMDADNVLATYERFHDRWKGYLSRIEQIRETRGYLETETNAGEKARLRVDLAAQRQSCRDIASSYNADAVKTNRSIFQGRTAPATLDMEAC